MVLKKLVKALSKKDEARASAVKTAKYKREDILQRNPSGKRLFASRNVARAEKAGWKRIKNTEKKHSGMVLMELK